MTTYPTLPRFGALIAPAQRAPHVPVGWYEQLLVQGLGVLACLDLLRQFCAIAHRCNSKVQM